MKFPSCRRFKAASFWAATRPKQQSVAEIFEVRCDAEIAAADKSDDFLQIVSLFSGDSNLAILELALHLESLALDRENNFLRLGPFEPLLNFQLLPRMPD